MATAADPRGAEDPENVVHTLRQAHRALVVAAAAVAGAGGAASSGGGDDGARSTIPGGTSGIASLRPHELMEVAELAGAVQRLSDSMMVRAVEAVDEQCRTADRDVSLAAQHGQRDALALLGAVTGASRRSLRRLRLVAGATAPRGVGSCGVLPPLMPHVAEAIRAGTLGLDQAVTIRETLSPVAGRAHPDDLAAAECALVAAAIGAPDPLADDSEADVESGSTDAREAGRRLETAQRGEAPLSVELLAVQARAWRDALDPDGPEPTDEMQRARRSFTLGQRADGMWSGRLLLPADQGAALRLALDAHNAPRTAMRFGPEGPMHDAATPDQAPRAPSAADGSGPGDVLGALDGAAIDDVAVDRGGSAARGDAWGTDADPLSLARRGDRDTRTTAQRQADTLVGLVSRAVELADAPRVGGEAATVVVTITAEELRTHGETGGGTARIEHTGDAIPAYMAARILCDGYVQACLVDDAGLPLRLGRRRRTHTVHQRRAILTSYPGGCANPTCNAPPGFAEIHHPIPWATGGETDVDNGVPLCQHCHSMLHAGHLICERTASGRWTVRPAVPLRPRAGLGLPGMRASAGPAAARHAA